MMFNNIPTHRDKWHTTEVTLTKDDNKSIKKPMSVMIVHNAPLDGPANTIKDAVCNWFVRTNKYTSQSLVDYINSKSSISGHNAMTIKEFSEKFPDNRS